MHFLYVLAPQEHAPYRAAEPHASLSPLLMLFVLLFALPSSPSGVCSSKWTQSPSALPPLEIHCSLSVLFPPCPQVFVAKQVDTIPIRTVLLNLTKYAEGRLMVVHSAGRNSVNVWHLVSGGEGSGVACWIIGWCATVKWCCTWMSHSRAQRWQEQREHVSPGALMNGICGA